MAKTRRFSAKNDFSSFEKEFQRQTKNSFKTKRKFYLPKIFNEVQEKN